jgi:hypothetical protein
MKGGHDVNGMIQTLAIEHSMLHGSHLEHVANIAMAK